MNIFDKPHNPSIFDEKPRTVVGGYEGAIMAASEEIGRLRREKFGWQIAAWGMLLACAILLYSK